jgi:hypothetical protein
MGDGPSTMLITEVVLEGFTGVDDCTGTNESLT